MNFEHALSLFCETHAALTSALTTFPSLEDNNWSNRESLRFGLRRLLEETHGGLANIVREFGVETCRANWAPLHFRILQLVQGELPAEEPGRKFLPLTHVAAGTNPLSELGQAFLLLLPKLDSVRYVARAVTGFLGDMALRFWEVFGGRAAGQGFVPAQHQGFASPAGIGAGIGGSFGLSPGQRMPATPFGGGAAGYGTRPGGPPGLRQRLDGAGPNSGAYVGFGGGLDPSRYQSAAGGVSVFAASQRAY